MIVDQESERHADGAREIDITSRRRLRSGSHDEVAVRGAMVPPAPEALLASVREEWEAASPALRLILQTMDDHTRAAWDAECHAGQHRFNRYGCFFRDAMLHGRFSSRWERCVSILEPMALQVMRTLDDLIGGLVVLLAGHEKAVDAGPPVNGVPLARVLDAVGNYARHHPEWRNTWRGFHPFRPQQAASILIIGRALNVDISTTETAFEALVAMERPMIRLLDMLSEFDPAAFHSNFDILGTKVMACASDVVMHYLPAYKRRMTILGERANRLAHKARAHAEHAARTYPAFIAALDRQIRR